MSFKDFKKQLKAKKEQEETFRALNNSVTMWQKRRDSYAEKAKEGLKKGDETQYRTSVALLKNAMFNLAQTEDMLTNFTIARDMCEAQQLNKRYVTWFNSIMKEVCKTCQGVGAKTSGKLFEKALYKQTTVSQEMREMLQSNNAAFACSVNSLSDIDDADVRSLLETEMKKDDTDFDSALADIEKEILGGSSTRTVPQERLAEGGRPAPTPTVSPVQPTKPVAPVTPATPSASAKPIAPSAPEKPAAKPVETPVAKPAPEQKPAEKKNVSPEDAVLGEEGEEGKLEFSWEDLPVIGFSDIAGLDKVKEAVNIKVLLPLKHPEAFEGYEKKGGGGLCLYGPPGTGKTMIAAAIAHEIGAKFCSVKPSDLLKQGVGNTEKAVKTLFAEARQFPCAVIYFDEMDSIAPKVTRATHAKQLRSEFLAQLQGIDSYKKDKGNVLFLIAATNKPWDIDSAFLRPGRFGTRIYVGLPDAEAREYMINRHLQKLRTRGIVSISDDLDVQKVVEATNGFNGADISNLLDKMEEISLLRSVETGEKVISAEDLDKALEDVHSTVQSEDIQKLKEWRAENDA